MVTKTTANNMRKIILLFLIITYYSCATKVNRGKYCQVASDSGGTCISFDKKNNFNWKTNTDFGPPTIGKGSYEIRNEKLYLKFKKDSLNYESTVEVLNTEVTKNNNISLVIKVVNEQKMPSPNALITLDKYPDRKNYADINGIVKIEDIPKGKKQIEIQVEPLDVLESYSFSFTPKKNKELLVTLHKAKPRIISDTLYVYKIIESTHKKLHLKNPLGKHNIEFLRIKE